MDKHQKYSEIIDKWLTNTLSDEEKELLKHYEQDDQFLSIKSEMEQIHNLIYEVNLLDKRATFSRLLDEKTNKNPNRKWFLGGSFFLIATIASIVLLNHTNKTKNETQKAVVLTEQKTSLKVHSEIANESLSTTEDHVDEATSSATKSSMIIDQIPHPAHAESSSTLSEQNFDEGTSNVDPAALLSIDKKDIDKSVSKEEIKVSNIKKDVNKAKPVACPPLTIDRKINPSCSNRANGQITVSGAPESATYELEELNLVQKSSSFFELPPGDYQVIIEYNKVCKEKVKNLHVSEVFCFSENEYVFNPNRDDNFIIELGNESGVAVIYSKRGEIIKNLGEISQTLNWDGRNQNKQMVTDGNYPIVFKSKSGKVLKTAVTVMRE